MGLCGDACCGCVRPRRLRRLWRSDVHLPQGVVAVIDPTPHATRRVAPATIAQPGSLESRWAVGVALGSHIQKHQKRPSQTENCTPGAPTRGSVLPKPDWRPLGSHPGRSPLVGLRSSPPAEGGSDMGAGAPGHSGGLASAAGRARETSSRPLGGGAWSVDVALVECRGEAPERCAPELIDLV